MTYELRGRVVLITGAAGGIGAATARALHEAGAVLVLTDLTQAAVDTLAREFPPERVLALALDVTNAARTREVVRQTVERFGRLDVAFANAGIAWQGAPATIRTCDEAEFERIIEVDLLGVWRTIRASLPEVVRNQGQVLVTASIYAFINGMVNSPYATSKAAIEMLARALRVELAGTGASAGVLYPGWIDTAMTRVAFGGDEIATRLIETAFPAPYRRRVSPEVVARAVVKGLRERKPRIVVPARWLPLSWLRGIVNIVSDWHVARHRGIRQLRRELEQRVGRGD